MKIALDAQLTVGTATGIGEYERGLIEALRRRGIDVVELCEPNLDPWRFDRRLLWDQILLPRRARTAGAQLLHCAAGTVPATAPLPLVVTVHDLAWLHVQSHAPAYARYYFGSFSLRGYRRAARIAVDSSFSRGELLDALAGYDPRRVDVVYPGVASDFCEIERGVVDRGSILAIGTVERRKNLEVLIRALANLRGARVVAVGPKTPYAAECLALAQALGVGDRLELRGYVTRSEVLALYATCAVVAVPSHYEGFGYAAAQALCAGVPCIVSDRSSLPEIAGKDAPIVPVDDAGAWTDALRAALNGEGDDAAAQARSRSIERFAWSASAATMENVYRAALLVDR